MTGTLSSFRRVALLLSLGFIWLAIGGASPVSGRVSQASRPNIVLILCDDLGYGDPRCYNSQSKIPTPNMDRLAREGMRFTDAHSPSGVCTPTRYGLLTGRYCWRTRLQRGVLQGYDTPLIEPGRETMPSFLRRQGYATAGFGKWHLGLGGGARTDYSKPFEGGPLTAGFDTYFGIPSSLDFPPYVFIEDDHVVEKPTAEIAASKMRREGGGGFWRAGGIAPNFKHEDVLPRVTERAVSYIRAQTKERPFFVYLPFSSPHTPWMPTPQFRGKSEVDWYGDFVVQTDDAVGRVLAALKERGLEKNTLVIFTSDNGGHWLKTDIEKWGHESNRPWRGQKSDAHEGGHRVPFIVRWPGKVRPGSVSKQLVGLQDVYATIANVVDAELPSAAAEDSLSFLPALLGKPTAPRSSMVHHSGDGLFAIRDGDWKLIDGLGSGGFTEPRTEKPVPGGPVRQLYNLKEDPREERNRVLDEPAIAYRLLRKLQEIRSR